MIQADGMTAWRSARVRPLVWMLLVAVLAVAITVPAVSLRHAASTALAAHAYIWPLAPQAGESAQLVVVLTDPADRAAIQGPWAQLAAKWDMVTMRMGTHQLAAPGPPTHADALAMPLRLDMAGLWWVQVTLRTPGRPVWHTRLQVNVAPPAAVASAGTTRIAMALLGSSALAEGGIGT
jgi:hypothetical protein